jgi:hypothetical protein
MSLIYEKLARLHATVDELQLLVTEFEDNVNRLREELVDPEWIPKHQRKLRFYERDMRSYIKKLADAIDGLEAFKRTENEKRFAVLMMAFSPGKSIPCHGSLSMLPVDVVRDMILLKHNTFSDPSG